MITASQKFQKNYQNLPFDQVIRYYYSLKSFDGLWSLYYLVQQLHINQRLLILQLKAFNLSWNLVIFEFDFHLYQNFFFHVKQFAYESCCLKQQSFGPGMNLYFESSSVSNWIELGLPSFAGSGSQWTRCCLDYFQHCLNCCENAAYLILAG